MDDLGSRSIIVILLYCIYKLRNWTVRESNGARFSALVQTIPGALPASYMYNGYWVIPGDKAAGAWR